MNQTTFARALKANRSRLQCSQEALARALGVSLSTLCNWEKGLDPKPLTQAGVLGQLDTMTLDDPRLKPAQIVPA